MTICCEALNFQISQVDSNIVYIPKFREFGIKIDDGGTSMHTMTFCPFCGSKLPQSLRDEWFAELGKLGLNPITSRVGEPFSSDRWWLDKEK